MLKKKKRKKISWKKRIGLLYGVGLFLTILFTNKELDEISKDTVPTKENMEYRNAELEEETKTIKVSSIQKNPEIAAADEQDKEIEEYLELLETLEKTQEEYSKMRENHLKIKERLNISPYEDTLYSDIISIGDAIIPVDNSVPIYKTNEDLFYGTNYQTSYYGTKEIHLVSEIVMAKDYMITDVDNMEDYELFKSMGFDVVGYKTVNQYSLQEDGTLQEEGKFEKEGVSFAFKPKEKTRVRVPKKEVLPC